jgi:hypothetical protein
MRQAEAACDKIMRGVGTDEKLITEKGGVCMHYRKPLRLDEIAQMAPVPEVRERKGRP